jgi:aminopeptidase
MNTTLNTIEKNYLSFAKLITDYSVNIQPRENVVIDCIDIPNEMIAALVLAINQRKGNAIIWNKSWLTIRALLNNLNIEQIENIAENELAILKKSQAYISLRASYGVYELGELSNEAKNLFQEKWLGPVHYNYRVHNTKWCSSKWPTDYLAKTLNLTLEELTEDFFKICLLCDYKNLSKDMSALCALMNQTSEIKILAEGTDLTFNKSNIPSIICDGRINFPDGEVYTAPVKDSLNGYITFNVPAIYQGQCFENIRLDFDKGKIIKATTNGIEDPNLIRIINTDEGSHHIGEFAFGTNPEVKTYYGDAMFDEKIAGSIHFAIGNSYKNAFNGNKSSIHWDIVLDLRKGGQVFFDKQLIQENGKFLISSLSNLSINPY